jgi:Zinc-ribbon containing domain
MTSEPKGNALSRLEAAYEKMLERVHYTIGQPGNRVPALRHSLEQAREKAVELGELSREEADRVAVYLERDLRDAAVYIAETGRQLRDWWRFDLAQVEQRLLDMFVGVADQTSVQLREMSEVLKQAQYYYTGELTGPGTLVCNDCGRELHFRRPGEIPPCPACLGTEFRRVGLPEEGVEEA